MSQSEAFSYQIPIKVPLLKGDLGGSSSPQQSINGPYVISDRPQKKHPKIIRKFSDWSQTMPQQS
jgi:hypothetical protein